MEEEGNTRITTQLEHVPNVLIHHILSLLPSKDATRTCVLSKSWLHAWSAIPTIRFTACMPDEHATQEEVIDYIKLIDRTLLRHLNNNMPIECLHIDLDIRNLSFSSLAEKWFQSLAFTNCLKELSLTICGKETDWRYMIPKCLKIPGEIFSCENLNTISLTADHFSRSHVMVNMNLAIIKCSFLRVLELVNVGISCEDSPNNLLVFLCSF
ncbi:putative F-box/FBD/LRR-repeat protein [Tanacetum coccineum]